MNKTVIINVPMDLSGSQWGGDLTQGPAHILNKGNLGGKLRSIGVPIAQETLIHCPEPNEAQAIDGIPDLQSILEVSTMVRMHAERCILEKQRPIVLGGEQTVDIGLVVAAARQFERVGIISLDGHFDCNTPRTSNTNHVHGMTNASHCGYGHPSLVNIHETGRPRVRGEDILIIGPNTENKRFFAGESSQLGNMHQLKREAAIQEEIANAARWGVRTITMREIQDKTGLDNPSSCPWFIREEIRHLFARVDAVVALIDLDHLHKAFAPGVAMPNANGMSVELSSDICRAIRAANFSTKKLVGLAIVEADPTKEDRNNSTVKNAARLAGETLGYV